MDHDITVTQYGIRLRPVRVADAAFISELRHSPHARGKIGDSEVSVRAQEQWIERYLKRANDWYFIIETTRDNGMVGTLGIYNVAGQRGEWGRWVIKPGIPASPASAWLAFHVCFDCFMLEEVYGYVLETNKEVLSLHKRIGNFCAGIGPEVRIIDGNPIRTLEFKTVRANWPAMSERLERFAIMAEKLVEDV